MALTDVPAVAHTTQEQAWAYLYQFVMATVEKCWAAGACIWPRSSHVWESGTVPAGITNTSFSDTSKTWCVPGATTYIDPWSCSPAPVGTPSSQINTQWYVVFDSNDPSEVVGPVPITSWTTGGTLNFATIADYITAKVVPSLASLVGRTYNIIGWSFPLWWSQRIMQWPNSYEYTGGTVENGIGKLDGNGAALPDSPSHTFIRDTSKRFTVNQHLGRDLLLYGDDGRLHRVVITSNTTNHPENTLTFATQTWTPAIGSAYVVVATNAKAWPGRTPTHYTTWYAGASDSYISHFYPSDQRGTWPFPATTVHIPGHAPFGDCSDCSGRDEQAFDFDRWSEEPYGSMDDDDICCGRPRDKPYAPYLWSTIRGIQLALESICVSYVEDKSYAGLAAIPYLNVAELFKLAQAFESSINVQTCTTGNVESVGAGGVNNVIAISGFTMPAGHTSIQVYYSIHPPFSAFGPQQYKAGRGWMTAANRLMDESSNLVFTQSDPSATPPLVGDDARTIVLTPTWHRFEELEFQRLYNQPGIFVPDTVTDPFSGVVTAVDPPAPVVWDGISNDCYGVGHWEKRPKSTNYIRRKHEAQSFTAAQGFEWEAGDAFANGDVARFRGEPEAGPNIKADTGTDGTGQFFTDISDPLAPYFERAYVGRLGLQQQEAREAQTAGVAEDGDTFFIKDSKKHWFDMQYHGGYARIESGTATGGSTTSLIDSNKIDPNPSSPTVIGACYWLASRFRGFTGPYVGFVIEVDLIINGATVTYQRLIQTGTTATATLTWTEPLPQSASGKPYRIKEVYFLSRYHDRTITLTPIDANGFPGTPLTRTVTGNSDDCIFFTPALPTKAVAGWLYAVTDPQPGAVLKYASSTQTWTPPTGADAVRTGVATPANWHSRTNENSPHIKVRFGKFMHGDIWGVELGNQIGAVLKALTLLRWDNCSWTSRAVDATPENNHETESACATHLSTLGAMEGEAIGNCSALWISPDESAAAPLARASAAESDITSPGCICYAASRRYAYLVANGLCNRIPLALTFYAMGDYPSGLGPTGCPNKHAFNNFGDSIALQTFTSFGGSAAAIRTTGRAKLGTLAFPTISFCGSVVSVATEGYDTIRETVLVRPTFTYA